MVPKARLELARPCEHYTLNVARLPFRHFGMRREPLDIVSDDLPVTGAGYRRAHARRSDSETLVWSSVHGRA